MAQCAKGYEERGIFREVNIFKCFRDIFRVENMFTVVSLEQ
jgi:hypothetical protein